MSETVTDVYRIDNDQAIRAVQELAASIQQSTQASRDAGDQSAASWLKVTAAFEAAKVAAHALASEAIDLARVAMAAEQSERQLERATGANAEAFKHQAQAMSEQLGVTKLSVEQMQMFLAVHGEAPGKIDETIRAVENWAAANGKDAKEALDTLVLGTERGSGSIKSLGLHIQTTGEFTQDLALYTAKLNAQWAGAAADNAETFAGKIAKIEAQTDLLKESVGKFLLEAADKTGIIANLANEIKGYRLALFGGDADEKARSSLNFLYNKRAELVELNEQAQKAGNQAFIDANDYKLKDIDARIAYAESQVKKLEQPTGEGKPHETFKAENADAKEDKNAGKLEAAFKRIAEANQKQQDEADALYNSDYEKAEKAIERRTQLRLQGEVNASAGEHRIHQDFENQSLSEQTKAAQKIRALKEKQHEEQLADEKIFQNAMLDAAKQFGMEGANFALDLLKEQLTAHTQFTQKMTDLAFQRGQITDYEGHVLKDHAAAQKQLQKEAEAATQARLADFLASIAKEAAIKALMEGGEAIATWPYGTAQHLAAAAAFVAVAVAAGGGAAAISANRGMTGDEKSQLQSAQAQSTQNSADRAARESKNAASTASGPMINVNYFGISGLTETEQQAFLEQQRRRFAQLSTGSEVH